MEGLPKLGICGERADRILQVDKNVVHIIHLHGGLMLRKSSSVPDHDHSLSTHA